MPRIFRGVVKNGVIVLEGDGQLPEGTKVTVVVEEQEEIEHKPQTVWDALGMMAGAARSGSSDTSERKDECVAEAIEWHWKKSAREGE